VPSRPGLKIQSNRQFPPTPEIGTLTLKVESAPQKSGTASGLEYVGAVAALAEALAWPLVFGALVFTQRRPLAKLLDALVDLVRNSHRIKLGDLIDVEVDRSAKQAAERDPSTPGITPQEIEAAARVGRLAEAADDATILARMSEFAREYEATRSSMTTGRVRTMAMTATVAKMRTLALASTHLLPVFTADKGSPGRRLAAIAILQMAPNLLS
jgi:hypothetical protein